MMHPQIKCKKASASDSKNNWKLIILLTVVLLLGLLARLDNWVYKNETFNSLAYGFKIDKSQASLNTLRQSAESNCADQHSKQTKRCLDYQSILTQNAFFGNPITASFGRSLLLTYGEEDWLEKLQLTAIAAQLAGGVLATLLCILFLAAVPSPLRPVAAVSLLALILLGYFRDDGSSLFPDPSDNGAQWWEAMLIAAFAALLFLPLQNTAAQRVAAIHLGFASRAREARYLPVVALVLAISHAVLPPVASWTTQIAAFLMFLFSALAVFKEDDRARALGSIIAVFFIFLLMSSGEASLIRKIEVSRHQLFLAFAAYSAYAAAVPRGRLVWALPGLAVFHVPGLGVLSLALFLAELPICIRRRRISPLAIVTSSTALCCIFVTNSLGSDLVSTASVDFAAVAVTALGSDLFLPTLLSIVVVLALSFWALFAPDEALDVVARCGFLLAQALGIILLAQAIWQADPHLKLDPRFFIFAELPWKTLPGIIFGAIVMLALSLSAMNGRTEGLQASVVRQVRGSHQTGVLFALILAVGCAKLELKPRDLVWEAGENLYAYFWVQDLDDRWRCNFGPVAGMDDRYALSLSNPINDPINFLSKLKLLVRQARGLHDPATMSIVNVMTDEKRCSTP